MHGVIFTALERFAGQALGSTGWERLRVEAGLAHKTFEAFQEYPDADALALVAAASRLTGLDTNTILEQFGEYIAPELLRMFWGAIDSSWKTIDVIENAERTVHALVRVQRPGAKPPDLRTERTKPEQVVLTYDSPRKLCALAKGLARGLARHYGEEIEIAESTCMLRGSPACTITVTRR